MGTNYENYGMEIYLQVFMKLSNLLCSVISLANLCNLIAKNYVSLYFFYLFITPTAVLVKLRQCTITLSYYSHSLKNLVSPQRCLTFHNFHHGTALLENGNLLMHPVVHYASSVNIMDRCNTPQR